MTRKCAAAAWGTRFRTDYVRRSSKADTKRHCSAIGEAGRAASTDAYGASRPLHVIELSTLVYAYRYNPRLAVELAKRAVRALTRKGYDVVVVSDGETIARGGGYGTELDGNITAIETAPAVGTEKAGRSEMQPFPANARGRRCEPE